MDEMLQMIRNVRQLSDEIQGPNPAAAGAPSRGP